jgi:endonuclease/exonuclease/phosphatase family metal-dependent hydrolase
MPRYYPLKYWNDATDRERAVKRLLALRKQLHTEIVPHQSEESFLLATWNIRDFDSNKFGHGHRKPEAFHYIAEIISTFDLVAVQEVNRDLSALEKVMQLLGGQWDYIVTDTTEGSGGNQERLAFVFDTRKIQFRNIAGEVVLQAGKKIIKTKQPGGDAEPETDEVQFARTPFVAAFQAGWFKFNLCTVHIYFGDDTGLKFDQRVDEIESIAKFFVSRQNREKEDYILLGDFNIVNPDDATMKALTKQKFKIPENLLKEKTNLKGDKHYDQIALRVTNKQLEIGASGVLDLYKSVYRNADYDAYFDSMPPDKRDVHTRGRKKGQPRTEAEKKAYYRDEWRTWQMSDHLPMWVQLKVDFTDHYLKGLQPDGGGD